MPACVTFATVLLLVQDDGVDLGTKTSAAVGGLVGCGAAMVATMLTHHGILKKNLHGFYSDGLLNIFRYVLDAAWRFMGVPPNQLFLVYVSCAATSWPHPRCLHTWPFPPQLGCTSWWWL